VQLDDSWAISYKQVIQMLRRIFGRSAVVGLPCTSLGLQ
jgi:hypothetical protein